MKALTYALAITSLLFCGQLIGAEATRLLNESGDIQLQQALEVLVLEQNLAAAVNKQELALVLVIVTDPNQPRLAEINGHNMVYAASLPKIAILLGAAVAIDQGRLELNDELQTDLDDMIRHSCNACATKVLGLVGREELLEILQSLRFRLYDKDHGGGLWVGKDYAKQGAYQRDPLHNLSHGATAIQVARFYYLLETGQLVNSELSAEMKAMLGDPGIKHKFVKGLADYPDAKIYRKSGSWRQWHADSALVEADGRKYIIVGLAEDASGGAWLSRLIKPIHEFMVPAKLAKAGH